MTDISPDITTSRINQILRTVFELLWFEPQGLYVSDILNYIKKEIALTEYEQGVSYYSSHLPRYEEIIRIGTIPFEKAGWLEKTKNGRWFLTASGRKACLEFTEPGKFFETSIEIIGEWKMRQEKRLTLFDQDPFSSAVQYSHEQIKQYMKDIDIGDLKIIVTSLLKALGCYVIWTSPSMGEERGFDLVCSLDPLGIKLPRVFVHLPRSIEITKIESIRYFLRDLGQADVGIYFSFGGFESDEKEFTLDMNQPRIRLIDLEKFVDLWISNITKIDQAGISKFPLSPVHFLSLSRKFG
jgi:restriction endonuclease Mrr